MRVCTKLKYISVNNNMDSVLNDDVLSGIMFLAPVVSRLCRRLRKKYDDNVAVYDASWRRSLVYLRRHNGSERTISVVRQHGISIDVFTLHSFGTIVRYDIKYKLSFIMFGRDDNRWLTITLGDGTNRHNIIVQQQLDGVSVVNTIVWSSIDDADLLTNKLVLLTHGIKNYITTCANVVFNYMTQPNTTSPDFVSQVADQPPFIHVIPPSLLKIIERAAN